MTPKEWEAFKKSERAKYEKPSKTKGYENHTYIHYGTKKSEEHVFYHRPRQRKIVARELIQFAPIQIGYGRLLKFCIFAIILMCILTLNLDTFDTIDKYSYNEIESTVQVEYTNQYLNTFNDNASTPFNRLVNCAKAFEIYGSNKSWVKILNNFATSTNKFSATNFIAMTLFLPLNLIINTGVLFVNIINALTGGETFIQPKYKTPTEIIQDTFNWSNLPFWTTPTWNIFH